MIRKAEEKDTKEIWEAHVASIREVCAKDYRPDQVERWSAFQHNREHWVKTMEKDLVLVVEENGKVEGFCHSSLIEEEMGEIVGLYLSPKSIGKGQGRELLSASIDYLRGRNAKRVFLKATKTAKGFYERMGFAVCGPVLLNETRGTQIECFPMEMLLYVTLR